MSRFLVVALSVFLLALAPDKTAARAAPESFADLVEGLIPAVVNVSTTQKIEQKGPMFEFHGMPQGPGMEQFREFFEQFGAPFPVEREATSLGSGFIIDPSGYIVTNNHVIAEADEITVTLSDETKLKAKIVGRDSKTDIALLKVESKKPLPSVRFGESDPMRVGDWVIAIGNPFGLGGSVSAGIISARSRNINSGPFDDFIQTDAAINRGNSGGPLFNSAGEVIGVNTAIFTPTGGNVGIGFAAPSSLVRPVIEQLKQFGRTHRGWLGVKIQHVSDDIAESMGLKPARGALVLDVNPDSPAAKAGIEAGDVILSFDGKPIKEMRNLPRLVAETKAGREVELEIWRQGRQRSTDVTLGELEEEAQPRHNARGAEPEVPSGVPSQALMGMRLAPLTATLRQQFGVKPAVRGVAVVSVDPDGEAATRGIRARDVITQVNQKDVADVNALKAELARAQRSGRTNALLRIDRGGEAVFVTVPARVK